MHSRHSETKLLLDTSYEVINYSNIPNTCIVKPYNNMATLSLTLSVFCFFIALWSFICSMMCHGSYGATSDYLHYGLWKYCFKYLDSENWTCDKLGQLCNNSLKYDKPISVTTRTILHLNFDPNFIP